MYVPYFRLSWAQLTVLQAKYAYRSISQFVKHVTQRTPYLANFPFPKLYKEVAVEESSCDSDSEAVETAESKPKSKIRALRFRKRPKDKLRQERVNEAGNEDAATSGVASPALPSGDGKAVAEGVNARVEEYDRVEGTSSIPRVRTYEINGHN